MLFSTTEGISRLLAQRCHNRPRNICPSSKYPKALSFLPDGFGWNLFSAGLLLCTACSFNKTQEGFGLRGRLRYQSQAPFFSMPIANPLLTATEQIRGQMQEDT